MDFRAFLHRHAELLRALGRWAIRLWVPEPFPRGRRTRTNGRGSRSSPVRSARPPPMNCGGSSRSDATEGSRPPTATSADRKRYRQASPGLQRTSISRPLSSVAARGREHRRCDVFTGARRRDQPRHGPPRGAGPGASVSPSLLPGWHGMSRRAGGTNRGTGDWGAIVPLVLTCAGWNRLTDLRATSRPPVPAKAH